jgi:glycosyltransferase involved in cell wall biosynthesis
MKEIFIATIMRQSGETGVQTHFNSYRHFLSKHQIKHQLITPFSYYAIFVYPVFSLRKLIEKFSTEKSVWWYRYWHAYFLKKALKNRLEINDDCVVYAQCPLSAQAAMDAKVSRKQRIVMVTHFNISQADEWVEKGLVIQNSQLYRSIKQFEADVLPKLDGLVFVSEFMKRELSKRIPGITNVTSAIIPNFLPDPGLPNTQTQSADLICIGTLEPRKNQQYLLDIMASLRDQGKPLTLTIIGDGPDRIALEEKAHELKISDLVRFTGFLSNGAEQLGSHRAYIHVATIENLPVTLIEAMARGLPIFVTPVGGIPELLVEGITGKAIPLNNARSAANIVAKAINDKQWMTTASIAARERFLNGYESEVVAKKLTSFLNVTSADCGNTNNIL